MRSRRSGSAVFAVVAVLGALPAAAQAAPAWTPPDAATKELALGIYRQLIDVNTTDSVGSVTAAAQARGTAATFRRARCWRAA